MKTQQIQTATEFALAVYEFEKQFLPKSEQARLEADRIRAELNEKAVHTEPSEDLVKIWQVENHLALLEELF